MYFDSFDVNSAFQMAYLLEKKGAKNGNILFPVVIDQFLENGEKALLSPFGTEFSLAAHEFSKKKKLSEPCAAIFKTIETNVSKTDQITKES